ncbi:tetratricopeptide repeat protein [Saccharospirillum mangrovi]|uniref:tetratricopeptide repeat protein n=1 Tax=Saccharospirillum mangrovi TaxID=2161747 RepID=UPI000D3AC416|nr:tetratricopeptide repeat protein [Saccharospirillum mangrovi]
MGTPVQLMRPLSVTLLLSLLLALLLAGCVSQPGPSDRLQQQEDRLTPDAEQNAAPAPRSPVDQLRSEALAAQAAGDWDKAAGLLERALRLDSRDADLYAEIAEVRLGQGRFSDAEQIALRGLTVNTGNRERSARLWHAIAQARSGQGNLEGARQARAQACEFGMCE